jgi:hypothetical protein
MHLGDQPDRTFNIHESPLEIYYKEGRMDAFVMIPTLVVVFLLIGSTPVMLWSLRMSILHLCFGDAEPTPLR